MGSSSGGWGSGGVSTGPFTYDFFGYREWVNQLREMLALYQKHSGAIRAVLPPAVATAMDALVAIADLDTWNAEGPG